MSKSRKYGLECPIHHRAFDLHNIAQLKYFQLNNHFFIKENYSDRGLTNILNFCGLENNLGAHNRLKDLKLTAECFFRIVYGKGLLRNMKNLRFLIIWLLFRFQYNKYYKSFYFFDVMITYNELYNALRKERYSEQLQPIPKKFIKEVAAYLRDKREIANKDNDDFSDTILKTKKQYENSIAIFKELILRRKKKILELAFVATETGISKRDFENMLAVEKESFDDIMKSLEKSDKKISEILKGIENEGKEGSKNKMIVFVEDSDAFLDLEGNKLGPFKKGDIANIAEEIANILIVDKKAESIDD